MIGEVVSADAALVAGGGAVHVVLQEVGFQLHRVDCVNERIQRILTRSLSMRAARIFIPVSHFIGRNSYSSLYDKYEI